MADSLITLLAHRAHVADATLLDAIELASMAPCLPWRVQRGELQDHWSLTQPALHRRLRRLQRSGLLQFETEHGTVLITAMPDTFTQPRDLRSPGPARHSSQAEADSQAAGGRT